MEQAKLPTEILYLSAAEAAYILPALDFFVENMRMSRPGMWLPHLQTYGGGTGGDVYRKQLYKEAWVEKIFAVHEKLRSLPPHRKMRCDAFDIAILAVGLRVTRHERLARQATGRPLDLDQLARKLEASRNRLKRAAIRKIGPERYDNIAESWSLSLNWARANIFCFRKRRGSNPATALDGSSAR